MAITSIKEGFGYIQYFAPSPSSWPVHVTASTVVVRMFSSASKHEYI
jgi:hypothetical protein